MKGKAGTSDPVEKPNQSLSGSNSMLLYVKKQFYQKSTVKNHKCISL
jgi:hypothetical protein